MFLPATRDIVLYTEVVAWDTFQADMVERDCNTELLQMTFYMKDACSLSESPQQWKSFHQTAFVVWN